MDRTNIFASHDDHSITGWFDYDATRAEWTDLDYNGNGSLGTGRGTGIVLTAGGKWVGSRISRWQGTSTTFTYVTPEQAREWLIANGEDTAVAEHFGELAEEEDRRPGRPEIGGRITTALGEDNLAAVDRYAGADGIKRAEWIRRAVEAEIKRRTTAGIEAARALGITTADIEALRDEAGQVGDLAQARICDLALGITAEDMEELLERPLYAEEAAAVAGMTPDAAWAECGRVIADARAQ